MTCQTHFGSKLAASLSAATYSSNRFSCAMFWSGLVTKDCMQSQSSFELMRKKYRPYSTASSSSRIYNHIINRCFSWCSRAAILTSAQGAFLWCSVPNKCLPSSPLFGLHTTGDFLNCVDVTTSPFLQCQLKFPKKDWSQVWTVQRMQNSHAIL